MIAIQWLEQELPAYNLTVGQSHTYTVGFEQLWVHNACDKGIVYERTNPKTGECYIGQCKSKERFEKRQKEHDKALGVNHKYDIVDQAEPGIKLDIAEHNKIQEKTKEMRAKDSDLVQNKKDSVGKKRW